MLSYTQKGSGQHIVLIHGFCETNTCFNEQVLLLSARYNVININLPGVGDSPFIPGLTVEKMAGAVHELLQHLGITQCIMYGHSMGGYVTLAYAKTYASTLKGFGLIHSTANADSPERLEKRDQAIRVIREKGAQFYVRDFVPGMFSKSFGKQDVIDAYIKEAEQLSSETLIAFTEAMKQRPDSNAFLAQTTLPVFFAAGKEDTFIPEADILKQAAACNVAKVCYLQHSGHMGMIEEPKTLSDHLIAFSEYCFKG